MFSVQNKVAIITGAANGIGAHIVKEFLNENAKYVAILDIDEISGLKLEDEIKLKYGKGKANFYKCDVTRTDEIYDIFDKVVKENGNIDILVNNAAIAVETLDMFKTQIEINFTAVVALSLKALELMRVDHGGTGGTIINVSSIGALSRSISSIHIYSATKTAVLCFSNRLGMDNYFSKTKVRVLTMCFGGTDTLILAKCKGFDEIANNDIEEMRDSVKKIQQQTAEFAAKGLVEGYKNGESGSTWLINKNNVTDITDKIKESDDILSSLNLM